MATSNKTWTPCRRLFSVGSGILCFALLYYYYLYNDNWNHGPHHISSEFSMEKNKHSVDSDISIISDDVSMDIPNVIYHDDSNKSNKTSLTKPGPVIKDVFPNIKFINKKRDKLPREKSQTVRILSWTPMYDRRSDVRWFSQEEADKCDLGTPGVRCEYTSDRSLYNQSDAVLIRLRLIPKHGLPKYRFSSHKWIYVEFESPIYSDWPPWFSGAYNNIFNLTNTHNPNSSIPVPRPFVVKRPKNITKITDYAKKKTKKVAWFVSNCDTQSKREAYVEELKKYIPVDIFGRCGNLTCPKFSGCNQYQVLKQYKFYLSFENSLCKDYFTEKFWRTMKKPMIGIALGAADYTKFIPKDIFIDVRDFNSPKALADYLLHLDKHNDEYNAFIHRKQQYDVDFYSNQPYICNICKTVYNRRYKKDMVRDIRDFYSPGKNCKTPRDFYKNIAPMLRDSVPGKF